MSPTSYQTAPPRIGERQNNTTSRKPVQAPTGSRPGNPPTFGKHSLAFAAMSVFRRRGTESADTATPPTPPTNSSAQPRAAAQTTAPVTQTKLPPHVERALITLTTKVQACIERLDAIEHRLDELAEAAINTPSHSDVLEVRLHSAKLAAELARATVELRGEIGMSNDEARREARLARNALDDETPVNLPVDVDLTAPAPVELDRPTPEADKPKTGWSASA